MAHERLELVHRDVAGHDHSLIRCMVSSFENADCGASRSAWYSLMSRLWRRFPDGGTDCMNVGNSVRKAIDDWSLRDLESSVLHACNALDGTAAKLHPGERTKERFTRTLRDSYDIFGPMAAPGINLRDTRFPVRVSKPTAPGGKPDIADVIYGIHRCTQNHGDELPDGFQPMLDAAGPPRRTCMLIKKGQVQLSDRFIFGLLAVAVLSPTNLGQSVPDGYYLTFVERVLPINEWWGRAPDFAAIVAQTPMPNVTLDFTDWMEVTN